MGAQYALIGCGEAAVAGGVARLGMRIIWRRAVVTAARSGRRSSLVALLESACKSYILI